MAFSVSQVWITLTFEQRLREGGVRLIQSDQLCVARKSAFADDEPCTLFSRGHFNSTATKNIQQRLGCWRWLYQIPKKLTRAARSHGLLPNRIKPPQPLLAIRRRMVQQQKRRRRHVFRYVAQVPLTAPPHWSKLWRLLLRIVTLTRTKLFKLHG